MRNIEYRRVDYRKEYSMVANIFEAQNQRTLDKILQILRTLWQQAQQIAHNCGSVIVVENHAQKEIREIHDSNWRHFAGQRHSLLRQPRNHVQQIRHHRNVSDSASRVVANDFGYRFQKEHHQHNAETYRLPNA